MFHMSQNLKVVLAVQPVDLRKSFHGLYAVAVQQAKMRLRPESLSLLLDGVDLRGAALRPWYQR